MKTDGRGTFLRRRWRSRRFIVHDASMRPLLEPGDRLLVDPATYAARPPVAGELVVVRDPDAADRMLVKRVVDRPGGVVGAPAEAPAGTVYVRGDNPAESRDSRAFGPVAWSSVVGEPWFRYYPARRRGRLDPAGLK